jgi:hypothetical protein
LAKWKTLPFHVLVERLWMGEGLSYYFSVLASNSLQRIGIGKYNQWKIHHEQVSLKYS